MKLLIASNNANKIREIKAILGGCFDEILSLREAGYDIDPEENGVTFEENAVIKAQAVADLTGLPALADDSGLEVDCLHGAPGVYSARYCGYHGDDAANNAKLIEEVSKFPDPRGAQYACALALIFPGKVPIITKGVCRGTIQLEPKGHNGFGYDPYFIPDGFDKTFAELPAEVKNGMSHRAKALELLKQQLSGLSRKENAQ